MLKNFINLFKSDVTVIKAAKQNRETFQKITKLYSEGNINLQNGNYITSKEIKKKQKDIFSYDFSI